MTSLIRYAVAGLILIGLWYLLVFTPLSKEQAAIGLRTAEARQHLADFQKTISEFPQFLQTGKELESLRMELDSRLYAKRNILGLLRMLNLEAEKRGLVITEITPPVEELLALNNIVPDSAQPEFLNISLRLEGGYVEFARYVGYIEQADFFRGINRFDILAASPDAREISLQLGFRALLGSPAEEA